MGHKIAVTDNGVHKIGQRAFLTDKNLVHRKVRKAFLTKDGVHRLVLSSGTFWAKYNCVETRIYEQVDSLEDGTSVGDRDTWTGILANSYSSDYHLDENEGFIVGEGNSTGFNESSAQAAVGGYIGDSTTVWQIVSLDNYYYENGYGYADYIIEIVALADYSTHNYAQGSTYYGTIEVEYGALPEDGDLVEGSIADGYCVMSVDGDYYYYVHI